MAKKISLTAIVGQEALHMERFLKSFSPYVDEIVLCRAVGNQTPDASLEIAKDTLKGWNGTLVLVEYRNPPSKEAWPHVDDFAAARNAAGDRATGDYVMWADLDDLLPETTGKALRSIAEDGEFDVVYCTYLISATQRGLRERMWRKGVMRWQGAIHEHARQAIQGSFKGFQVADLEIVHDPIVTLDNNKIERSAERNLRILSSLTVGDAGKYFYLHRDSYNCGKYEDAIRYGSLLLDMKDAPVPDRYRVRLNLADIALTHGNFIEAEKQALFAMSLHPERREAPGTLSVISICRQSPSKALQWAKLTNNLPKPKDFAELPAWADAGWYGYKSIYQHSQCLRANKQPQKALELEVDNLHSNHPKFSLLHATRGRAQQAIHARNSFFESSTFPEDIEHIFAIDEDDTESMTHLRNFRHVVVPKGGGCVAAWNAAARESSGDILVQMSDDWTPPNQWDVLVANKLDVTKPQVLSINDGHRTDDLICMAILTREYYNTLYKNEGGPCLFSPEYKGVFSDNEFTDLAKEAGVVIEAKEILFVHNHPLFYGKPMDTTYQNQNSQEAYKTGEETYLTRKNSGLRQFNAAIAKMAKAKSSQ